MRTVMRHIAILTSALLMQACSAVGIQGKLVPHPEDYQSSGYAASTWPDQQERMVVGHGQDRKLVLRSPEYQLLVTPAKTGYRLLAIGPCILPVIPIIFYTEPAEGTEFHISISSLQHRAIGLENVLLNVLWKDSDARLSYNFTKAVRSSTGDIEFVAHFPVDPDSVAAMDLSINILVDDTERIVFPRVQLYRSSYVQWGACII